MMYLGGKTRTLLNQPLKPRPTVKNVEWCIIVRVHFPSKSQTPFNESTANKTKLYKIKITLYFKLKEFLQDIN